MACKKIGIEIRKKVSEGDFVLIRGTSYHKKKILHALVG